MKAKFKINQRVNVFHKTLPFNGTIERVMHWENPFNVLNKKGIDYAVRADDDKELYKCSENELTKI